MKVGEKFIQHTCFKLERDLREVSMQSFFYFGTSRKNFCYTWSLNEIQTQLIYEERATWVLPREGQLV